MPQQITEQFLQLWIRNHLLCFEQKQLFKFSLSFFIQNASIVGWHFCEVMFQCEFTTVSFPFFFPIFFFFASLNTPTASFQLLGLIAYSDSFSFLTNFLPVQIIFQCDQVTVSILFLLKGRKPCFVLPMSIFRLSSKFVRILIFRRSNQVSINKWKKVVQKNDLIVIIYPQCLGFLFLSFFPFLCSSQNLHFLMVLVSCRALSLNDLSLLS